MLYKLPVIGQPDGIDEHNLFIADQVGVVGGTLSVEYSWREGLQFQSTLPTQVTFLVSCFAVSQKHPFVF